MMQRRSQTFAMTRGGGAVDEVETWSGQAGNLKNSTMPAAVFTQMPEPTVHKNGSTDSHRCVASAPRDPALGTCETGTAADTFHTAHVAVKERSESAIIHQLCEVLFIHRAYFVLFSFLTNCLAFRSTSDYLFIMLGWHGILKRGQGTVICMPVGWRCLEVVVHVSPGMPRVTLGTVG
eukprot:447241-Amphidinium_carterae.3